MYNVLTMSYIFDSAESSMCLLTMKPGNVAYYNPEIAGIAYYFTLHCQQLRGIPKYLDKDEKEDTSPSCEDKSFVTLSKSGTTCLILVTSAIHMDSIE